MKEAQFSIGHNGVEPRRQHYLTMFGATLTVPLLICPKMCLEKDDPNNAYIISTMFFVSGVVTLLQSTFGVR